MENKKAIVIDSKVRFEMYAEKDQLSALVIFDSVKELCASSPILSKKVEIEEIIARLKELQQDDDIEGAHMQADWIICNLLDDLGYTEVTKEYGKISKWYAQED